MEDTCSCSVLDLVTDSMGMVAAPFEGEGEGEPLCFLLSFRWGKRGKAI